MKTDQTKFPNVNLLKILSSSSWSGSGLDPDSATSCIGRFSKIPYMDPDKDSVNPGPKH